MGTLSALAYKVSFIIWQSSHFSLDYGKGNWSPEYARNPEFFCTGKPMAMLGVCTEKVKRSVWEVQGTRSLEGLEEERFRSASSKFLNAPFKVYLKSYLKTYFKNIHFDYWWLRFLGTFVCIISLFSYTQNDIYIANQLLHLMRVFTRPKIRTYARAWY